MGSDAESKSENAWRWRWWMIISFVAGSLIGPVFGISLPGLGPRPFAAVVKERRGRLDDEPALRQVPAAEQAPPVPPPAPDVQAELAKKDAAIADLQRQLAAATAAAHAKARETQEVPPLEEESTAAPPPALAPPVAHTAPEECDIPHMGLGIDPRFDARGDELRKARDERPYPTFEELYQMVVNKPYEPEHNIWHTFPNAYNLTSNFHFPYSNLKKPHIRRVIELLGRPAKFAVEVGSFHGHSAIWQALVLDQHEFRDTPLLCIDPWTGALGMLLNRDDWDKKLTPGEIADGRSTSYWQFMLNVKAQLDQKTIGQKHIIPLVATSIVGARFLLAMGLTPDMIFLDSAHEKDETFIELSLYYRVLAEGGVLFGDDLSWDSVKHDVTRFTEMHGLPLETSDEGVIWMIKKPKGAAVGLDPSPPPPQVGLSGRRRQAEPQEAVPPPPQVGLSGRRRQAEPQEAV